MRPDQSGSLTGITPGALHINGNYLQTGSGRVTVRLAGTTPENQYDQLHVNGAVALNGRLDVALANSFVPSLGNAFDILDWGTSAARFRRFTSHTLPPGLIGTRSQLYTDGVLSVGDRGRLQRKRRRRCGRLCSMAQNTRPVRAVLAADGNSNNHIDSGDLTAWRTHFGQTAGSGSSTVANAAVPEPSTLVMLVLAAAGVCSRRRRAA